MSELIKALQQAMEIAEKVAVEAPMVTQAVESVVHPAEPAPAPDATLVPGVVNGAQDAAPVASTPAPDTLGTVAATVGEVATVVGLIPGLQASHLVALLTHVTALVNLAEQIKTAVQQHAPLEWAQIESVFSSAVGAFHAVPKA